MRPALRALAAAPALCLLLTSCGKDARARGAVEVPRPVRLVRAEKRDLPRPVTAVGALAAEERADLSFKVAGRLARFRVDIGSRAAPGEVLAELERTASG